MTMKTYEFRSRRERERESEIDLARNYRMIGNRAVAAASQECCRTKAISPAMDKPSHLSDPSAAQPTR